MASYNISLSVCTVEAMCDNGVPAAQLKIHICCESIQSILSHNTGTELPLFSAENRGGCTSWQ